MDFLSPLCHLHRCHDPNPGLGMPAAVNSAAIIFSGEIHQGGTTGFVRRGGIEIVVDQKQAPQVCPAPFRGPCRALKGEHDQNFTTINSKRIVAGAASSFLCRIADERISKFYYLDAFSEPLRQACDRYLLTSGRPCRTYASHKVPGSATPRADAAAAKLHIGSVSFASARGRDQ
jgi:hypothetical protein